MGIMFFVTAISFGIALAMDAFSVSLANGLKYPCMRTRKMCLIAGVFSFYQALMPLIGWFLIQFLLNVFTGLAKAIPYAALILLCYIGGKMLYEGIKGGDDEECCDGKLTFGALMIQGIATSIDALSTGLDMTTYNWYEAVISALIIAIVTFIICMTGLFIGKKAGTKLAGKASILGGVILIAIGLKIFISGVFF